MSEFAAQTEPASAARWLRRIVAALLPGVDPLWRREWALAAMFLFANVWVRLMIAGQAAIVDERPAAFGLGAFGVTGGLGRPVLVFLTACAVGMHVLAWRDAAHQQTPEQKPLEQKPKKKGATP